MTAGRLQLDREAFLARYWQREPLLIREAIPAFKPPLDAAELAGLALEAGVESRLIEYRDQQWLLQHGPFTEADFNRDAPWTLLVQAVDHYVDEVAGLRRLVDFLPQWLMDDVMVSYAVDGGSVGPHYDNYDVFLLQGEGRRHWRVGQACDSRSALLPHRELRILREGKHRKFRETIEQVTYNAQYGLGRGQDIQYVTERAVFRATPEGLLLTEIAPGIEIERDILAHMAFAPIIPEAGPKLMDARLFRPELLSAAGVG